MPERRLTFLRGCEVIAEWDTAMQLTALRLVSVPGRMFEVTIGVGIPLQRTAQDGAIEIVDTTSWGMSMTSIPATDGPWERRHDYSLTDWVHPSEKNDRLYECVGEGRSGPQEPTWGIVLGQDTVDDDAVMWRAREYGENIKPNGLFMSTLTRPI